MDIDGLKIETQNALNRLRQLVDGLGHSLIVTSAKRETDTVQGAGVSRHYTGQAVDFWIPGLTKEQQAKLAVQAGFSGGYISGKKNFLEATTGAEYDYSLPGEKYGFGDLSWWDILKPRPVWKWGEGWEEDIRPKIEDDVPGLVGKSIPSIIILTILALLGLYSLKKAIE